MRHHAEASIAISIRILSWVFAIIFASVAASPALRLVNAVTSEGSSLPEPALTDDTLRAISRSTSALEKELSRVEAAGDFQAAAELLRKILLIEERELGRGHWYVVARRCELASARRAAAASPQDQRSYLDAIKARGRASEIASDRTSSGSAIGLLKAEAAYGDVLGTFRAVLGPNDPHTLAVMTDIGVLQFNAGRFADAEATYQGAVRISAALYGREHPRYAAAIGMLGRAYQMQGNFEHAKECLVTASKTTRRTLGRNSVFYAVELQFLAELLNEIAKFDEAEAAASTAVGICRNRLAPDHILFLRCLHEQARARAGLKKWNELIATAEELLPKADRVAPNGSRRTIELLEMYAIALHEVGREDDARSASRRARIMRGSKSAAKVFERPGPSL